MTIESSVVLAEDGRPAFVRRATAGPGADRLRWEVAVLRLVDHPGTVELLRSTPDEAGGIEVVTAFAAGGTLEARRQALDARAIVATAAGVADTLTSAHAAGVVHGSVSARHILFDGAARPRLCGWAEASYAGTGHPHTGPQPADDVAGLGGVLHQLARGADREVGSSLRALASRSTADDPRARPPMGAVLASLRAMETDLNPSMRVRARSEGRVVSTSAAQKPRRRSVVAIAAGAGAGALVIAAVTAVTSANGDREVGVVVPSPAATATADDRPSSGRRRPPRRPDRGQPAPSTPEGADRRPMAERSPAPEPPCLSVEPTEGCVAPVTIKEGVLTAGRDRWKVAEPGDSVTVGRWTCDATPTPAVLRIDTGSVWVYRRWAERGRPVTAEPVGVVDGAVTLTTVPADDGCDRLAVETAGGTLVELDTNAP